MNKRPKGFDKTLWDIMCGWFDLNWTNPFIQSIYHDGVTLNITCYKDCLVNKYYLPGHLLTDQFLNDAREEYQRQKQKSS
jgi:hypothetical protein